MDIAPVYCEIAMRRLEDFRQTGKTGWQNSNPFERKLASDADLPSLVRPDPEVAENVQATVPLSLEPGCCNVFIWVAVWRDSIRI